MNTAHFHLILNHIPVMGSLGGLGLLALALWRHSEDVKRAALGMLMVSALFAIPAYLTGEPAEDAVKGMAGVAGNLTERHEKTGQFFTLYTPSSRRHLFRYRLARGRR